MMSETVRFSFESWSGLGGEAEIQLVPGALAIIHTKETHERIRGLLENLASISSGDLRQRVRISCDSKKTKQRHRRIRAELKRKVRFSPDVKTLDALCANIARQCQIPVVVDRPCRQKSTRMSKYFPNEYDNRLYLSFLGKYHNLVLIDFAVCS